MNHKYFLSKDQSLFNCSEQTNQTFQSFGSQEVFQDFITKLQLQPYEIPIDMSIFYKNFNPNGFEFPIRDHFPSINEMIEIFRIVINR